MPLGDRVRRMRFHERPRMGDSMRERSLNLLGISILAAVIFVCILIYMEAMANPTHRFSIGESGSPDMPVEGKNENDMYH